MIVHTKIQKWGNGLALRIAGVIREIPHFKEGTEVDIEVTKTGFTVKKTKKAQKKLPFSEAQLLKGLSPQLAHADLLTPLLPKEFE